MSAEIVEPLEPEAPRRAPRLSLVQTPTTTVSTLGFVGIILMLIAMGLGGVMVVSTSVGAQSRELSSLRKEATELGYQTAALTSQMQKLSSASALAMRATELGMVPNPYPAFINLGDSSVSGDPTPVTGKEMPFLRGSSLAREDTATPEAATEDVTGNVTSADAAEAAAQAATDAADASSTDNTDAGDDASVADETSEETLIASADDATQEDQ